MTFLSGPARVALYLRAETLLQATRQATRQAALLHQAVDSKLGWHLVAVFSDLTLTPWGGRRPGRDGALTSARTGFDVLLVSRLDRLTRNSDELMELIQQLTAADVTLCVTLRPHGPQSDLEIRAVDEFLVGVYRSLAGQHDAVWDLPAAPPPAGGAR
jgi:DNA invertase Pin-like site-specific DNA recombinase